MENTSILAKLKLPGRVFQLPSRAALYQNGELEGADGEVQVQALSALTEINLKNPDLLFNGSAVREVCAECVPNIKKPDQLFARDIDALMIFLRLVTYGPVFEIQVKHNCEHAKNHSYTVNLEQLLSEMQFLDPTSIKDTVTMQNGQVVKLNPIRFEHMIKLFQMNTGKDKLSPEDVKKNIVFNLTNVIQSVDGVTDRAAIEMWVKSLTSPMQNRINEAVEALNEWGPKKTADLKCKDCGEVMTVDLPLDPVSFFSE